MPASDTPLPYQVHHGGADEVDGTSLARIPDFLRRGLPCQ